MRIFCGVTQCGEYLGEVGASAAQMNPSPVWRIQPGWRFGAQGILERNDIEYRQERRLMQETFGRPDESQRVSIGREVNLPIVVRCPKCHNNRLVLPEVAFRPVLLR